MFRRGGRLLPSAWRALFILPFWIAGSLWLWSWWLNNQQIGYEPLYWPLTAAMAYEYTFLPTAFIYFLYILSYEQKSLLSELPQ
jgi:hypothetical protein